MIKAFAKFAIFRYKPMLPGAGLLLLPGGLGDVWRHFVADQDPHDV